MNIVPYTKYNIGISQNEVSNADPAKVIEQIRQLNIQDEIVTIIQQELVGNRSYADASQ